MPMNDEEIRVAIVANADGVEAGTAQATATLDAWTASLQATQAKAAASYAASNAAFVAAQTNAAQLLADSQKASTAQIIAAYDAINVARDLNVANAQAYVAAITASQLEALNVENYAASAAAQSLLAQVGAERAAADSAYTNAAAQLEQAGALDVAAASSEANTVATTENTVAVTFNAQAQREAAYAVGELATARYGRLETSLLSLSARTGLMTRLMSPLGLAIGGVAVAMGGLAAASIAGAVHEQELQNALLATGNAAGLTVGELQRMASQLASGNTTVGDARDAILALARSGEYSGEAFRTAAGAAVDFASLTGQSTQQAAKYVEALAHATTRSLIKANEQYHFLSLAQFTNIENLRKEGKEAEATKIIIDAFYSRMHTGAQESVKDEGYIARGWDDIKRAVSGALNAVESWGAKSTITEQIAALQSTLSKGGTTTDSGFIPYTQKYIAAINAQIAHLKALQAQKEKEAASEAAANKASDDAIKAKFGAGSHIPKPHHTAETRPHRESTKYADDMLREDGRILAGLQKQADERERIAAQVNSINEGAARKHAQTMLQIHIDQLRTAEAQGQISHAQELAGEKKLYDDEYAAQLAEYQKELALEQGKPVQIARINAEIEALQDAHTQKMAKAAETAAQAQQKAFERMVAPISQAFTTSINGIIQGTQTMQMAVGRMLDSILLKYVDVAIKSAVQWIAGEAQKTMATVAGTATRTAVVTSAHATEKASAAALNLATIRADAAKAAAGAYSAVVGIPYVGPVLAPIAAATAFAAVGAYQAMASFDVGAWNIPHDMPAMVHAGETILPRPFAEDFRKNGGSLGGTPSGEHHYHIHANDAASFHDMLQRNPEALAAGFRNAHRTGAFA